MRFGWCACMMQCDFDISAFHCVWRFAAAGGGPLSCFIHELINGAQIALLSILTAARPASSGAAHCSLVEEDRMQHKLCIQLFAPWKIWHRLRTCARIKSPFIPGPALILSPLIPSRENYLPPLYVCLQRETAGPLRCGSFSTQCQLRPVITTFP